MPVNNNLQLVSVSGNSVHQNSIKALSALQPRSDAVHKQVVRTRHTTLAAQTLGDQWNSLNPSSSSLSLSPKPVRAAVPPTVPAKPDFVRSVNLPIGLTSGTTIRLPVATAPVARPAVPARPNQAVVSAAVAALRQRAPVQAASSSDEPSQPKPLKSSLRSGTKPVQNITFMENPALEGRPVTSVETVSRLAEVAKRNFNIRRSLRGATRGVGRISLLVQESRGAIAARTAADAEVPRNIVEGGAMLSAYQNGSQSEKDRLGPILCRYYGNDDFMSW